MAGLSLADRGQPPAPPADFNIGAYVTARASASPDKPALELVTAKGVTERWTYAELEGRIRAAITGLRQAGLGRGDRVALRLPSTPELPVLFFALAGMGALPVPLSAQLTDDEVARILDDLQPAGLCLGPGVSAPAQPGMRVIEASEWRGFADLPTGEFAATRADDPAYIVYTSGTSGRARGVVHAHRAAFARQMMWRGWMGLTPGDRMLHAGAFNWTYTLGTGLTDPWGIGATALVHDGPASAEDWAEVIRRHRPTIFAAVPGIFRRLVDRGHATAEAFHHLRHALSAGEALPDSLRHGWETTTGRPLYQALGMSECSTFLSFGPDSPPVDGMAGLPQPGRRIALLPEEGGDEPVPLAEPGLIAIDRRDPGLMLGYWNDPDGTAACMRGGWFVTADLATMDDAGLVAYLGRADDVMTAGGYRVSPTEVEDCIARLPGVADVAAVDLPVRDGVRVIAAFVAGDGRVDAESVRDHCTRHLAAYKCPREIRFLDTLPRGANGKLSRRALVAAHGWRQS